MIQELVSYLNVQSTKEAKCFGHLYEAIALIEREKRCRTPWLSHRTICKNTIAECVNLLTKKSSVLVLGSGPLHEIPIEFLASQFKKVDLVDVVHLKKTKKENAHRENVFFIEADITELESDILKNKKIKNKSPSLFLDQNYDLVISANLLSQLAYHLRNFLEKKAEPQLSCNELDRFAYQVTHDHFLYLNSFFCPVLLITDVETAFFDKNEQIINREAPYIDFPLPTPFKEWWWNVAPIPEYQKDVALKMKVQAFILNNQNY